MISISNISLNHLKDEDFLSICYHRSNQSEDADEELDIKRQRLVLLIKAVIDNELTDTERNTVYKKFFDNKSISEIASECDINPSTVSRTLSRAEKKIRSYLRYVMYALNGNFSSEIISGR